MMLTIGRAGKGKTTVDLGALDETGWSTVGEPLASDSRIALWMRFEDGTSLGFTATAEEILDLVGELSETVPFVRELGEQTTDSAHKSV